jgi:hypothetical protein
MDLSIIKNSLMVLKNIIQYEPGKDLKKETFSVLEFGVANRIIQNR